MKRFKNNIPKSIREVAKKISQGELGRVEPEPAPGETEGDNSYHTEIYNYFTPIGGNNLLYSAQSWVRIRLTLETAGPVAISTRQDITPVLSGKGRLLITGEEIEFYLAKGDRIFITSPSVNRVAVTIEPVPWLQSIAIGVAGIFRGIRVLARGDNKMPQSPQIPDSISDAPGRNTKYMPVPRKVPTKFKGR